MPPDNQSCATCTYWSPAPPNGRCLRFPPVRVGEGISSFPKTSSDTWCGEWKTAAVEEPVAGLPPQIAEELKALSTVKSVLKTNHLRAQGDTE